MTALIAVRRFGTALRVLQTLTQNTGGGVPALALLIDGIPLVIDTPYNFLLIGDAR